jgi:mono/diheme cytochrome c family protein
VSRFAQYVDDFVAAFSTYLDKTYPGFQSQMLAGLPGMADATGVSSSHGYELLEASAGGRLIAGGFLPDSPGLSDFMAVWEQEGRTAEWDPSGQQLINGGGQYNGNIPIPMYRNLAASMTMGLANTDIRVAAFSAELLDGLPATPYPFAVDDALAETGEALFAANCAGCHQPHNGRVYSELGTSMARSNVINTFLMEGARAEYKATCGPTTTIVMYGKAVQPCAEFKGRALADMDHVIMRPLDDQHGYNATALTGVWALAPYLHNGSVPTLYHLLVPAERPASFIKSQLDYDQEKVGFAWESASSPFAYTFDTTAFHALNNRGHDTDLTVDGVTYKLNWSDDIGGAMALLEYLKTL